MAPEQFRLTENEQIEACQRLFAQGKNKSEIAVELGLHRQTVCKRLRSAPSAQPEADVELPEFPEDDIDVDQIIAQAVQSYEKRAASAVARKWFEIKVKAERPIGIAFVGDPHLDNAGTNWPLLRQHVDLMKNTPGVHAVNIGDTTDNWVGRLVRLYADSNVSKPRAQKLAKWFLADSGIPWRVWLLGNHDAWGDGAGLLRLMNTPRIPMEDWEAKFQFVFPSGRACRVWASHDFKGHSMWNSGHGAQRAALMRDDAHIFASGHRHNWFIHKEENADRGNTYTLLRARGYKHIDSYASHHGYASQAAGSTVLCVVDPKGTDSSFVRAFEDLEEGCDYLTWKRGK